MDVASPLEVNHIKPMCCATILVIVFYQFAICYLLHECCLLAMNVFMLCFSYSA